MARELSTVQPLLMSPEQAAEDYGCSSADIMKVIEDGQLPYIVFPTRPPQYRIEIAAWNAFKPGLFIPQSSPVAFRRRSAQSLIRDWPAIEIAPEAPTAVYVLQCDQYFKIGWSIAPFQRVVSLHRTTPIPNWPICLLETSYAEALEHTLHCTFADKRTNGEWFRLDEIDVTYLCDLGERLRYDCLQSSLDLFMWKHTEGGPFTDIGEACTHLMTFGDIEYLKTLRARRRRRPKP